MSNRSNYTATDLANASRYAQINVDKLLLNAAFKSHPHIISHCTFNNNQLVGTETFLSQLNCVLFKNTKLEKCTPTDAPRWLRTGDESFKLGCNWSCYNLKPIEYDSKKQPLAQTLEWKLRPDNSIELFPVTNYWFEFPIVRDEARFKNRVNNFPAGFDTTASNKYRLNDTYCEAFVGTYDPTSDVCKSSASPILTFVLGEALVKNAMVLTKDIQYTLPLSKKAKPVPTYSTTLEQWKANIDSSWHMQIPDPINPNILPVENSYSGPGNIPTPPKVLVKITETTVKLIVGLIKSLFTVEFWTSLGVQVAFDLITRQLVAQLNKRILLWLVDIATEQRILFTAMTRSLVAYGLRFFQLELLKYALKTLAWSAEAAINIIGIALVVFAVADVALTILDPYNLNQQLSSKQIQKVQQQMTEQFYKQDRVQILLNASLLVDILNVPDREQIELQSILYTYQYLKNLTVNSDGFPIIKDFTILARTDNTNGPVPVQVTNVYQDTATFSNRAECFKIFKRVTLVLGGLLILTLIAKLYLVSLLVMILIVFILAITYLNLSFDVPKQVTGTIDTIKQLFGTILEENANSKPT